MAALDGAGAAVPFFDIGWKPVVERTQLYLGIGDTGSQRDASVASWSLSPRCWPG